MRKSFPEQTIMLFRHLRDVSRASHRHCVTHTDAELATAIKSSSRQVRKYLRRLRDEKYIRVERKRVFINAWFNQRFIYLNED